MFDEAYLEFLRQLRHPDYHVCRQGSDLVVSFSGRWAEVTYWETLAPSIINETYYRTLRRSLSQFERAAIYAEGVRRLRDKIMVLRSRPRKSDGRRRMISRHVTLGNVCGETHINEHRFVGEQVKLRTV